MKFNVNFDTLAENAQSAAKKKTIVNRAGDPKLTFSSLKGKMAITGGAIQMMDIDREKDTIVMYDFGKEFEEVNGFRMAVSKGYMKDGKQKGANIGTTNQFNYSGIWAIGMFPDVDFDPTRKTTNFLVEKGLLTVDEDGRHAKSDEIVTYDVVQATDDDGDPIEAVPVDSDSDGNVITVSLYPLVNRTTRMRNIDTEEDDE